MAPINRSMEIIQQEPEMRRIACVGKVSEPIVRCHRARYACWAGLAVAMLYCIPFARSAHADEVVCNGAPLPRQTIRLGGPANEASQPDLLVKGPCSVPPGTYYFGNVNILDGGRITFEERPYSRTQFWASAIIVENGGALTAGSAATPFGAQGGSVVMALYGADQSHGDPAHEPGRGTACRTPVDAMRDIGPCGIPLSIWNNHDPAAVTNLPGGVAGHFQQYEPLSGDQAAGPLGPGYFGYKVLAVSYGGTLALFGAKGVASDAASDEDQTASGLGWVRLAAGSSVAAGATQLSLDRAVQGNWMPGDKVVLTATDGQPEHAEDLAIDSINGATVTFHRTGCGPGATDEGCPGLQWAHHASSTSAGAGLSGAQPVSPTGTDPAAAVALLTRSIAIVGAGDAPGQSFDAAAALDPRYSFGGHTIARRGFRAWEVQGVEFYRLGQDSRRDRNPINFDVAGAFPPGTFVKDSVVRDTMTSWYRPNGIMGVALQRVAGYRSIGRSYYLAECSYVMGYAYCQQ